MMSKAGKPEERAAAVVEARPRVAGGPWFIELKGPWRQPVRLGPYANPAIAREQADKIRELLTALLREANQES